MVVVNRQQQLVVNLMLSQLKESTKAFLEQTSLVKRRRLSAGKTAEELSAGCQM